MPRIRMRKAWLMVSAVAMASAAHAEPLSFSDAVNRAAAEGPTIEAGAASVRAAELAVGPANQLPDPQLVLGLQNVPIEGPDAYRLDRDEMTMQAVGLMQDMPSGAERRARRAMARAEAGRAEAAFDVARLEARMGAAGAWIALHFAERRAAVLDQIKSEADSMAAAARVRLAGGGDANAAIAAGIEASRAADGRAELAAAIIEARAELRRWIGDAADEAPAGEAPAFDIDPAQLREHLRHHPELASFAAEEQAAQAGLRMARAERVPDWSWTAMYQRRNDSFGDMASVEVRIGLPLLQPWRQGPLVEASRADQARVTAGRVAAEREHSAMLEAQLAVYEAVNANLRRARETRLPLARQRADASAGAFAAGAASAEQLIAARRDALEAELDLLELEQRRAELGAALTLQYGNAPP